MSPRAAWRLESFGFTRVYEYAAGKADWLAAGLPREGEHAHIPVVGDLARRDVPTCGLDVSIADVERLVRSMDWDQCVVVNEERVVFGRIRLDELGEDPGALAEDVMQNGPTTFRASVGAHEMLEYMRRRGKMRDTLVTDPEGRLIGVIRRDDLEKAIHELHARTEAGGREED
jgi:CBS domain-containing protein